MAQFDKNTNAMSARNNDIFDVVMTGGLTIPPHDYIDNTYTDGNLTKVEYYVGGSGGTLVATIDMTYDVDGNVLTVTRS